ncbi:hypothetical protein COO60DRAFT_1626767 [Scenedesmus sp. NREL 46B-D3]|nr:hypothetical protein COO60DRAFT_1626767 [Scenedesmus sp. NREL 46B-D3]
MASDKLKMFPASIDARYVQYADQLHNASFTDVKELAAASPELLEQRASVPIGPAGAVVKAASAPGLSEGRVLELVSHEVQRVSQELQQSLAQELQQSLAQSMEEMQAGLLSVISSRLPQRTARGCLATISERGESLGDAVGLAGTKYIKA